MHRSHAGGDEGFTLVEVLFALAILTAAVSVLVAALGTATN
ncbi:MAG: prepilin-type N-terminal cleavage/methylation domain-containing protein [Frankiales bacterium]|nr:prepilin-type N-terminal cleavage/methylation domain-containing protein [Frankiales bacterium]